MGNTGAQKIKLLYLWEILSRESDEENPILTHEILALLQEARIPCDRRTLTRDIADLNKWGFEVMTVHCGHEKGYYVADRKFSVPELRILIDAVQGSNFVTEKKTAELSARISSLAGKHKAKLLHRNCICYNGRKRSNEQIYYNVDTIDTALSEDRQISFCYFHLNDKRERVYVDEGARLQVEPIGLVLTEGRYYLTAQVADRESLRIFRVDRMEAVTVEEKLISPEAKARRKETVNYVARTFKMYAGEEKFVTLQFPPELSESVYDRFGEMTPIQRMPGGLCHATVPVQISPTFFGWLFQYGDKMRLISPPEAVSAAKEFIMNLPYFKEELP